MVWATQPHHTCSLKGPRGHLCRYLAHICNVLLLYCRVQAAWRGYAARKLYEEMRRQQGALVIQSNWRCSVKRGEFQALRQAATVVQGAWRWAHMLPLSL